QAAYKSGDPLLYWPHKLKSGDFKQSGGEGLYVRFAEMLLIAPYVHKGTIIEAYQAFLNGIERLPKWLVYLNNDDNAWDRLVRKYSERTLKNQAINKTI